MGPFLIVAIILVTFGISISRSLSSNKKPQKSSPLPQRQGENNKSPFGDEFQQKPLSNTTMASKRQSNQTMSTLSPTHSHPSSKGNVRVEKVYVEDSMGQLESQGCSQHYYERYVLLSEDEDNSTLNEDLARVIVLGEAINTPAYKKYRNYP